jgi:hypothetical protein
MVKDKYFLKIGTKGKDNCCLALIAMKILAFLGARLEWKAGMALA